MPPEVFKKEYTALKELKQTFNKAFNQTTSLSSIVFIDHLENVCREKGLISLLGCRSVASKGVESYSLRCLVTRTELFYAAYVVAEKGWVRFEDEVLSVVPSYNALLQLVVRNEETPLVFVMNRVDSTTLHSEIAADTSTSHSLEEAVFDFAMKNKPPLGPEEWTCDKCHCINSLPNYICNRKVPSKSRL